MARKKFRMVMGAKEHPETFAEREVDPVGGYGPNDKQLLYPGDVFEVEELLILRQPELGGWMQKEKLGTAPDAPEKWVLKCAVPVEGDEAESFIMRDEPSLIVGINISEQEFTRRQQAEDAAAHVLAPALPVAKSSPASVRRRG